MKGSLESARKRAELAWLFCDVPVQSRDVFQLRNRSPTFDFLLSIEGTDSDSIRRERNTHEDIEMANGDRD